MTVRCPKCSTRYRLPPRSTLGRNPTYRCTRCRHVFSPAEEAEAPAIEEESDEFDVDDSEDAPVFTIEPSQPDPEEDEEEVPVTTSRRSAVVAAPAGPPSPIRAAIQTAIVVSIVYAVLSIYLHTHPVESRALLGAIPLIGEEMAETRLHPGNIQLTDVRGDFKRVHGDRLVFVVTGTAINNAPVAIAGVQIEGRLIGGEERRQIVYAGAAPQDVSELGIREIELLQTLKPSADWVLRPGEQDRFLVAFVDPPQPLTEFAVEVVAVRGTNSRVDSPLAKRR
jgi:predicted Zn finger-like uncharacterized protein